MNEAWWSAIISALVTALLGTGGIAAWKKARDDRKKGIDDGVRADFDAVNARALAMLDAQVAHLITPLTARLEELEREIETLTKKFEDQKSKYWKAIIHIRHLDTWISKHLPDQSDGKPGVPTELIEDI